MTTEHNITPAMRQYLEAKAQVPDAILLFRMGDFYELFFEDALEAAPIMEVVVTSRDKSSENPVPMCGVPHHALKTYVGKLLAAGKKVAICEQMEDPSQAKGIVRREIVRVVSPGVVLDLDALEAGANNFLAAVYHGLDGIGFACLDASTGCFRACRADDFPNLRIELARLEPREVVFPEKLAGKMDKVAAVLPAAALRPAPDDWFEPRCTRPALEGLAHVRELGPEVLAAAGALVGYLKSLQRDGRLQLEPLELYEIRNYLVLDETAVTDLELLRTYSGDRRGSLLALMDRTCTAMGARLLRRWLTYPLVEPEAIDQRLDAVQELVEQSMLRENLAETLKQLYDVERLATRVVTRQATPRELQSLAQSAALFDRLRQLLTSCCSPEIRRLSSALQTKPEPLVTALRFLKDPAPPIAREGGIFLPEYNVRLAELLELTRGGREWLLGYEAKLRSESGIQSLKVGFNKVFGYYIEVTRANLHLVPQTFIRKQTLVNAERYFTPELKEYEEKVLHAQDQANALEEELFLELLDQVAGHREAILAAAASVATLDVFVSFARLAHGNGYCRPRIDRSDVLDLKESRHPVVEKMMPASRFVPNDVFLDAEKQQLLIITGPNMAGKSTVMRQVALTVIMAQMGSFVPAREATIGLVDRIFTRVGATDSLARGLSTFMVEMKEAAEILKKATRRSLVILDEVGRGTSTYDGLSIAWSMVEYLHDNLRARTLFATHYHELTQMSEYKKRARNFNIAVKEFNDEILFLHRLVEGGTNRSYGIQVARLAGVPLPVIDRAKEILSSIEDGSGDIRIERPRPARRKRPDGPLQPSLFDAVRRPAPESQDGPPPAPAPDDRLTRTLKELSLDTMSPIEAFNLLYRLKKEMEEKG
ncbi:MAG: DNA mismatch repair protein MutS [Deltaproteobacteria bacterium]|nr:DNA mismatch repair protein MutS [Deltaproteobacteria bacterium]